MSLTETEILEEKMGSAAAEKYEELAESQNFNFDPTNFKVTTIIVATIESNGLSYDAGIAAEEAEIASRAIVERRVTVLEDYGYIQIEECPIDVGRPRKRLRRGEDWEDSSIEDFFSEVVATVERRFIK